MSADKSKYISLFLGEAEELLGNLDTLIVALEANPDNEENLNAIFRITHTLKGNAAAIGLNVFSELAHDIENVFDALRKKKIRITPESIDVIFSSVDLLKKLFGEIKKTGEEISKTDDIHILLGKISNGEKLPQKSRPIADIGMKPLAIDAIRVPLKKLDNMINLLGELLINVSRLENIVENIGNKELVDNLSRLKRTVSEFQYNFTNVRLIALASLFGQFPRTVRDISSQLNKKVSLEIEGSNIEVDVKVVEKIKTPLVQIIRNAISHGIELPEERVAKGKSEEGKIFIRANSDRNRVVISVSDDGAGIDLNKIISTAIRLKIISEDKLAELTEDEIYELIFAPGFTTADSTSRISGRGVGMDAVRSEIASIGGAINVRSKVGVGTTFSIDVPISVAIIKALICDSAGHKIAIPTTSIQELFHIKPNQVESIGGEPHIKVDGNFYSLCDTASVLFNRKSQIMERDCINVVLANAGSKIAAFVVDKFIKESEIAVKSFWSPVESRTVSGVSLLGDGTIVLILDLNELLRLVFLRRTGKYEQRK